MFNRLSFVFIALFLALSQLAEAVDFSGVKYDVYKGDIDQDGHDDYYFHGKSLFVLLHGEIATPIVISAQDSYALKAYDDPETFSSQGGDYQVSRWFIAEQFEQVTPQLTDEQIEDYGLVLLTDGVDYYLADFNNDGLSDILFPVPENNSAYIFSGTESAASPSTLVTYTGTLANKIINAGESLDIRDANFDGFSDIVFSPEQTGYAQRAIFGGGNYSRYEYILEAEKQVTPKLIGSTGGEFKVNESGAATYTVPITLPSGVAGVAPSVAVSYSSQAGNGILGVGWSLAAGSSVTRCRATELQEGYSKAIQLNSEDRFCLNGQKLMLVSGSSYGAPNSTYKTEIDNNAVLIKAVSGSLGNPDHFIVIGKDGSLQSYGTGSSSNNSKVVLGDTTFSWSLAKSEDNVGNAIEYGYLQEGTDHYLSTIRYAGGAAQVQFNYSSSRPDPVGATIYGYELTTQKRLDGIVVTDGGGILRSYKFDYLGVTEDNEVSRLYRIQECVDDNKTCLPSLEFKWEDKPQEFSTTAAVIREMDYKKESLVSYAPADINGDGCMDMVYGLLDVSGSDPYYRTNYILSEDNCRSFSEVKSLNAQIYKDGKEQYFLSVLDYNADGRQDIAIRYNEEDAWRIYLAVPNEDKSWKLSGSITPGVNGISGPIFADLNADGLVDNISDSSYQMLVKELGGDDTSSTPYSFQDEESIGLGSIVAVSDFDGDGRVDIVTHYNNSEYSNPCSGPCPGWSPDKETRENYIRIHSFDGSSSHVYYEWDATRICDYTAANQNNAPACTGPSLGFIDKVYTGDVNGDGLPDVILTRQTAYELYLNVGDGFGDAISLPLSTGDLATGKIYNKATKTFITKKTQESLQLIDYNRDGKADLFWHDKDRSLKVALWDHVSQEFKEPAVIRSSVSDASVYTAIDLNNDNAIDLIELSGAYQTDIEARKSIKIYKNESTEIHNVITEIDNNAGNITSVSYEHMNTSAHYARMEVASPEIYDVQHPCYGYGADDEDYCKSRVVSFDAYYKSVHNPFDLDTSDEEYLKPVFDLNSSMVLVTSVESSAPVLSDNNAKSKIKYYYAEAKMQAGGRGFLGFKNLTTIDAQTNIRTETTYSQRFPFVGSPVRTNVYAPDGELLSESVNVYENKAANDANYYQPRLVTSIEKVYPNSTNIAEEESGTGDGLSVDESTPITIVTTQADYDDFGNVTNTQIVTEGSYPDITNAGQNKTITQSKLTVNTYGTGETVALHGETLSYAQLGRLTASKYTGTRNGITTERDVNFTYYANGLLNEERVVSDDQSIARVTKHYYDSFGNKTIVAVTGWDGEEVVTRESENVYDANGRYLVASKDHTGKVISEVLSRDDFGRPTVTQTVTGVVTTIGYDLLGREITKEDNTAQNRVTTEYLSCNQVSPACPANAQYAMRVSQQYGSTSVTYFDRVGRPMRKAALDFENRWVYTDTQYDNLGRVTAVSAPYFSTSYAQFWTTTSYDVLGRTRSISAPADNEHGLVTSNVTYNGATTTTTNPAGQTKRETKNSFGELIQVEDNLHDTNNSYAFIRYVYNSEGKLTDTNIHTGEADNDVINTHIDYDDAGRKKAMQDVDKGTWSYKYNAFDELISQIDGKNQMVVNKYDLLGRITSRTDYKDANDTSDASVELHTTYYYDGKTDTNSATLDNAYGQVTAVILSANKGHQTCASASVKTCEYAYFDFYGRPYRNVKHIDTDNNSATPLEVFTTSQTYDVAGRVDTSYDAMHNVIVEGGEQIASGVKNHYTATGFLESTIDLATNKTLYQTVNTNARGQVTKAVLGQGNTFTRVLNYSDATGRLEKQIAYHGHWFPSYGDEPSANTIQHISYEWDDLGNLLSRKNQSAISASQNRNLQESFCYDSLNRLVKTNIGTTSASNCEGLTSAQQDVRYNSIGNITYKEGVGSYTYHTDRRHAVKTAGGSTYYYDNNGNNTSGDGRTLIYSTFDKPITITKGNHTSTFAYGADRGRYLQIDSNTTDASKNKITVYLGDVERIKQGNTFEWRRTVAGGQQTVTTDTANAKLDDMVHRFIFNDHLGSLDVIVLADGTVEQSLSFNPWGERRKELATLPLLTATELFNFDDSITNKGYTGHEMLDEVGLIHMNGRIYDAKLARFLQADPFVQAATTTGSYNRYSYIMNNPLNGVDPSGFNWLSDAWHSVKDVVKVVAVVYLSVVTYGWASQFAIGVYGSACTAICYVSTANIIGGVAGGAAAGFTAGVSIAALSGANSADAMRAGVKGAVSGAITGGVAGYFNNTYSVSRVLADGIANGAAAELTGGSFKEGLTMGLATSVVTYINVKLREFELEHSSRSPGQIGDSPGFRGQRGKLGGGRLVYKKWIESGAEEFYRETGDLNGALNMYYDATKGSISPLGGHQGAPGIFLSRKIKYGPGSILDFTVESFAGTHDALNHWYHYLPNGMVRARSGFGYRFGEFLNAANVLVATPIVAPSVVPDHLRFALLSKSK